jgi:hypothetical protein
LIPTEGRRAPGSGGAAAIRAILLAILRADIPDDRP